MLKSGSDYPTAPVSVIDIPLWSEEEQKEFIEKSFRNAKKGVFIQSLFTDRNLEYDITIHDSIINKPIHYNIHSVSIYRYIILAMEIFILFKIIILPCRKNLLYYI